MEPTALGDCARNQLSVAILAQVTLRLNSTFDRHELIVFLCLASHGRATDTVHSLAQK